MLAAEVYATVGSRHVRTEACDLTGSEVRPAAAREGIRAPALTTDVLEPPTRGGPHRFDFVDDHRGSLFGRHGVQAPGVATHGPSRETGHFFRVFAAPRRREHSGNAVGEQTRTVAVVLPEVRLGSEVELAHGLAGKVCHRVRLRPGERRLDGEVAQGAERQRANHMAGPVHGAVGATNPRLGSVALDRGNHRRKPYLVAERGRHGIGQTLRAASDRVADHPGGRLFPLRRRKRRAAKHHQSGDVAGVFAVAGIESVAERHGPLVEPQARHPVVHGDVEVERVRLEPRPRSR